MSANVLSSALIQAMSRNLSVADLIHTTETLKQSGQIDAVANLYATWIEHNAEHPLLYAVLFNYSVVLSDSGKLDAARASLERAITLNADFLPAHINLGRVHERLGAIGSAIAQWSVAINKLSALNGSALTHKTMALNQSARALEAVTQDVPAEDMLRQSLELDTNQREVAQHYIALRQRQCEWPVLVPAERISHETLMNAISPLSAAAYTDDPMLQLAVAWNYNQKDVGVPPLVMDSWPQATASPNDRLRIGYVCSDFREHALGYLLAEVLGLHDRKKVEVFAYYCGPAAKDPLHLNFKATSDHWIEISGMDDVSAANRIAQDGIQILVDLNGYTREGRTKLFALRPAPVIVNWLGYPGTMGSPYHQYLIADEWIVPPQDEIYYSEKVLRLPCYQPSNRKRIVSERPVTRRDAGLPEDAMVYCCFNGAHKITRFTYERWLTILSLVPGSVLWLLGGSDTTNERLKKFATDRGIAAERVIFADKLTNPEHLARYKLADLFLDSTPYGAHTTGSDSLWMGVPVLTLSGRSFASRVCGSLVHSAGLPDLVCTSVQQYIERAVELGKDRDQLLDYRKKLQSNRDICTTFDIPLLVRSLEELYTQMWQDFKNDCLPKPDLHNLEVYMEVGAQVRHDEIEVQAIDDYQGWWKSKLTQRSRYRPIMPDQRFSPEQ